MTATSVVLRLPSKVGSPTESFSCVLSVHLDLRMKQMFMSLVPAIDSGATGNFCAALTSDMVAVAQVK